MSLEERVTEIEGRSDELQKPERECIFCHERKYGLKTSVFTQLADKRVKEYFYKDGINTCDHDKMSEPSIWFADFLGNAPVASPNDCEASIDDQRIVEISDPRRIIRDEIIRIAEIHQRRICRLCHWTIHLA